MDYVPEVETAYINISPTGFHMWAEQYYQCRHDFKGSGHFSPVPYFLLSRAIELELKSRHLIQHPIEEVRKTFGHNLSKLYNALPADQMILSATQTHTLSQASAIYTGKGFEYFNVYDVGRGYSHFPSIEILDSIAKALITADVAR